MLEITINAKQLIAAIWSIIAIVISVIIVLAVGLQFWGTYNNGWPFVMIAAFFGIWLLISLPVFLLIAVWGISSPKSAEE